MRIKISMAKASSLFVPHLIFHSLFPSLSILKLGVIVDKTRLQGRVLITDLCLLPYPACIYRTLNIIESIAHHKSASLHCDAESLNLHISITKPCTPNIHNYFSLFFCFVLWRSESCSVYFNAIGNKMMLKKVPEQGGVGGKRSSNYRWLKKFDGEKENVWALRLTWPS